MSSLRNAVKRRTHKERQQPAARRHLGLLEKRGDYRARARDFHKKERALATLRRKAEERNPDEFYFAMERARTRGGVHVLHSGEANKYSAEQLRLMKTQDAKYVGLKAQAEGRKVERLRASLQCLGGSGSPQGDPPGAAEPASSSRGAGPRHTVFVDDEEEVEAFSPEDHFDTPAALLGRTFNRPRKAQLADPNAVSSHTKPRRLEKWRAAAYRGLAERQARQQQLEATVAHMQLKRELMGKGTKRKRTVKAEDGTKRAVYSWKRERRN